MVFSELEGLKSSKKEKTSQNAEEATQFIIQNNIRFLTTSGKLLAGKIINFNVEADLQTKELRLKFRPKNIFSRRF